MEQSIIPFSFPALFSGPSLDSIASGILLLAMLCAAIFSAVLLYHWTQYGSRIMRVWRVACIYFAGIAIFLLMMFAGK